MPYSRDLVPPQWPPCPAEGTGGGFSKCVLIFQKVVMFLFIGYTAFLAFKFCLRITRVGYHADCIDFNSRSSSAHLNFLLVPCLHSSLLNMISCKCILLFKCFIFSHFKCTVVVEYVLPAMMILFQQCANVQWAPWRFVVGNMERKELLLSGILKFFLYLVHE